MHCADSRLKSRDTRTSRGLSEHGTRLHRGDAYEDIHLLPRSETLYFICKMMDPRVKTSVRDLAAQFKLSKQLYDQWLGFTHVGRQVRAICRRTCYIDQRTTDCRNALTHSMPPDCACRMLKAVSDPAAKVTIQNATAKLRTLFGVMQDVDSGADAVVSMLSRVVDEQLHHPMEIVRRIFRSIRTISRNAAGELDNTLTKFRPRNQSTSLSLVPAQTNHSKS